MVFFCIALMLSGAAVGWALTSRRRARRRCLELERQLQERGQLHQSFSENAAGEQKQAKKKMDHLEILVNALVENSPAVVFVKEAKELCCTYLNKAGEELLGCSRTELLGKNDYDFLPKEQADFFSGWDRDVLKGRKIVDIPEEVMETPKGRRILRTQKIPVLDPRGEPLYLLNLSRDLTEQDEMEKALAQARDAVTNVERFKAQFMANMSHEIRTPMNAIIGMTQILRDTPLTPEQKECVETVHHAGEALLQVINQILDFAAMESGRLKLETTHFDLRETFESVMDMLSHQAQAKGLELTCFIPNNLPTRLLGDPTRLGQILTHLVGNALKFTERGEVLVRVEKLQQTGERMMFRVTVQDTGPGIAPEDRQRLFQAFTQADASSTRRHGGAGLGLAVSKKLIELMGGDIGVDSLSGKGSTFWFTIQMKEQETDAKTLTPTRDDLAGVRALIVDDNETNRKILHHQLTAWGLRADPAVGGIEAVALLSKASAEKDPYQVALLDMWMPGMDGLTLARAIKKDPALSRIKIVIMTSLAQRPEDAELQEAGVQLFLTKPVRQAHLLDSLTRLCRSIPVKEGGSTGHSVPAMSQPVLRHSTRILLAEDNPTNQQVALLLLDKLGYAADVVANGQQAMEVALEKDYDLILMDCQMPDMDGYTATAKIRRLETSGRHIPVIAMTANTLQGDQEKCLAAGMDDYISKPIRLERLAAVLSKWAAPVDPGILSQLREEGDSHLLKEVIGQYLEDTPPHVAALRAATLRADAEAVRREAHLLKGSSGNFNARRMVKLCARLETLGRSGSLANARELVDAVDEEFGRVRAALEAEEKKAA